MKLPTIDKKVPAKSFSEAAVLSIGKPIELEILKKSAGTF
jgi:hypothetical protein